VSPIVGDTDDEAERDREGWRDRLGSPERMTPAEFASAAEDLTPGPGRPAGDQRQRDRLGSLEPRNVFADAVLPLRLWGSSGLFARVVPSEHVLTACGRDGQAHLLVVCPCGAESVLERAAFTECAGECSRWFVSVGDEVRVHRFEAT
jgi:hypothetical protein